MARPQLNTVNYFPFYCEEGSKMFYLEETYGNDGFACFVKILRELAKTENHYLDLSKNTTLMFLSAKCKVPKLTLESIIKDLVELGKFDKVLWEENSIIWCQDFIDSIQDAYVKRKSKCITYPDLLLLLVSFGVRKLSKLPTKGVDNPQSKVDKNKVKKTREGKVEFSPPTIEDVVEYFVNEGYTESSARKAWKHYDLGAWKDTNGKPVVAWKQKMHTVWFKPENVSKETIEARKELEIKPNGYPNPQTYYATCWEKKIKPVRWENGDVLSESEIEQQHKLHKVGDYQYA